MRFEGRTQAERKWNQPSIDFYVKKLKADNLSEWDTMRIEGDERIEKLIEMRE